MWPRQPARRKSHDGQGNTGSHLGNVDRAARFHLAQPASGRSQHLYQPEHGRERHHEDERRQALPAPCVDAGEQAAQRALASQNCGSSRRSRQRATHSACRIRSGRRTLA